MEMRTNNIMRLQLINVSIAILGLGSLWSLSEVMLGGAMRNAGLPFRAGILTGVGIGIMGISMGIFRKPLMLLGIALVAILGKQLVVPILHVSIMCKANSCLAVMLQGFALTGVVTLTRRKLDKGNLFRIASGMSAGLLAVTAFYFIGMHLAPCPYLMSFNYPGGYKAFLTVEGLVWMTFSGILFPVGYWVGARFRDTIVVLIKRRPLFYFATSAALVVCCWVVSAFAISAGF